MSGAGGAARRDKPHYTFDNTQLQEIGRGNQALLNRLARIATRGSGATGTAGGTAGSKPPVLHKESSAARNRRKAAEEIERDNLVRGGVADEPTTRRAGLRGNGAWAEV
jgi:hypothetical protein